MFLRPPFYLDSERTGRPGSGEKEIGFERDTAREKPFGSFRLGSSISGEREAKCREVEESYCILTHFDSFWIISGSQNRLVSIDFDALLSVFGSFLDRETD